MSVYQIFQQMSIDTLEFFVAGGYNAAVTVADEGKTNDFGIAFKQENW